MESACPTEFSAEADLNEQLQTVTSSSEQEDDEERTSQSTAAAEFNPPPRKWRKNTPKEKRIKNKKRKQRKRREKAEKKRNEKEQDIVKINSELRKYKGMARSFWDRWQWELLKRKEAMKTELGTMPTGSVGLSQELESKPLIHSINPASLRDPTIDGKPAEVYLGRGSFSVVRLQFYRGIKVAVKEFLPRSVKEDVINEATILSLLNHPYLPYIFGMCTSSRPHRIVLQFHGIDCETITLSKELTESNERFNNPVTWFLFFSQLLRAMSYLHNEVKILHNDLKGDNILITTPPSQEASFTSTAPKSILPSSDIKRFSHHIVVIDFGKATTVAGARRYHLSEDERARHSAKYPHIAPEVVHGESKQSPLSDMYSVGRVLKLLADNCRFAGLPEKDVQRIQSLIDRLTSALWHSRPSAEECLKVMDTMFL